MRQSAITTQNPITSCEASSLLDAPMGEPGPATRRVNLLVVKGSCRSGASGGHWAGIARGGANQTPRGSLLGDVRGPSGDAADGEGRRECGARQPDGIEEDRSV